MKNINATIKYRQPLKGQSYGNFRGYRYYRSPKRIINGLQNKNNGSKLAFKGLFNPETIEKVIKPGLEKIGIWGTKPIVAPLVSTLGILAVRPAITMMDKKTPKKDRIYSASWQTGIALGGLGVMIAYGKKIENLSHSIAEKLLGSLKSDADRKLAKESPHLIEAVLYGRKNTEKILNMTELQADKAIENFEKAAKSASKGFVEKAKGFVKKLNPAELFRKSKKITRNLDPFIKNPGLVINIRENKNIVKRLLKRSTEDLKKIREVAGLKNGVNFIILMTALTGATALVTRYLKPMMNFVGAKLHIKSFQAETQNSKKTDSAQNTDNKNKKKWDKTDKTIFAGLGIAALIEGINIAGNLRGKGNIAYEAIGKAFKAINKKLNLSEKIGNLTKGLKNKFKKSDAFKNKMANQANVGEKWLKRSIVFNLFGRLGINLPTGQIYNATRDVVDNSMQLSLLGAADKTLVKPAQSGLAKLFGVSKYNRGIRVIADQGIKNLLIVCAAMGFMNNAVSSKVVKLFKKLGISKPEEKEQDYQKFKRNFLASQNLKGFDIEDYKKTLLPLNNNIFKTLLNQAS